MARTPRKRHKRGYLFDLQNALCAFCYRECVWVGFGGDSLLFTLEHMHPLDLGGKHDMHNLVGACYECNRKRQDEFDRLGTPGLKRILLVIRLAERRVINENRTLIPPFTSNRAIN